MDDGNRLLNRAGSSAARRIRPARFRRMLRKSAGALRSRFARSALVLVYHRVARANVDPWELAVTPEHFSEHLEVLRRLARPLPLQSLVEAVRGGAVPRRAVVVTLDDGYADNLRNAEPLLRRHDVPATCFLTAG